MHWFDLPLSVVAFLCVKIFFDGLHFGFQGWPEHGEGNKD